MVYGGLIVGLLCQACWRENSVLPLEYRHYGRCPGCHTKDSLELAIVQAFQFPPEVQRTDLWVR